MGWFRQEYTGSHRNMEAVFWQENSQSFSGDFRPVPCGKVQEGDRNAPEKSRNFPVGILLPCSGGFQCIPAGSSVFFHLFPAGSFGTWLPESSTWVQKIHYSRKESADTHFLTETALPENTSMKYLVAYVGNMAYSQFLKVMIYSIIRLKIVSLNRARFKCSSPSEYLRYNYHI